MILLQAMELKAVEPSTISRPLSPNGVSARTQVSPATPVGSNFAIQGVHVGAETGGVVRRGRDA